VAGQRYAVSHIITGTTMPTIIANPSFIVVTAFEPRTAGARGSQTDLLTTDTPANSGTNYWSRLS
jgi:hypothetical protein